MNHNDLNVGDIVYLDILKDNRDWGYNPGPDGTKCEIVSYDCESAFGGPNKYWPTVRFLDGERRGETERILTLHLSEDDPRRTIQIDNLGTVTCKHSGTFSNGEFSLRFEPASNGEADRCDIVVFNLNGDICRYENLTMECLHEGTKVYSGEYFTSIPPRHGWICSTCGEMGTDLLGDNKPRFEPRRFRQLWKLFGHGE